WWGAALFLGCVTGGLFMLRPTFENFVTIGIGNATLLTAMACCWQGSRAFHHCRPLWLPVLATPALWLVLCLIPQFMASVAIRIVVSAMIAAPMLLMSAVEFWHGRREQLPSRGAVVIVFLSFALVFAIRIPLIGVLPFPFGALPMEPGWLGAFNLIMFAHTILLAVLLVSMSKERLEFDQRIQALTDPLTGALNRRAFVLRSERLLQRHQYESAPLCVLFLDLDYFKSLNDEYGHSAGDDVLVHFVNVVNTSIRPTDFVFRMGGEEFCCLLPYTNTEQAHRVAERIRHQFEIARTNTAGASIKATVSIGIASTEIFGYDIETLTWHADMAVYAAKRRGRNQAVVSTADGGHASGRRGRAVAAM
ncbi:MAG TPA: GGDEF domain-containing protein, partial [Xanthobacteraceae bacterium]|nr:GGDEF domain-containing protein [Xanthobacteraceae bacterium]